MCDNSGWLLIATAAARGETGGMVSGGDIDAHLRRLGGYTLGIQTPSRMKALAKSGKVSIQQLPVTNSRGLMKMKPRYALTDAGVDAVFCWARELAHDASWRAANGWPEARPIPREHRVGR